MKIVVNHLTRMKPGYICVAGIDPSSGSHVRPVIPYQRLTTSLLAREGGPFAIASVVDLGPVQSAGAAPEVEDHNFDPGKAKATKPLGASKFWDLLEEASEDSLMSIFGPDLQPNGHGMAVDVSHGQASLGCLLPAVRPEVEIDFGKVKLRLTDGGHELSLSVTDLRLYEADQKTPRTKFVRDLDRRIRGGERVILAVGLARPWRKPGDSEERHFLQVNNLHLEGDPVWSG